MENLFDYISSKRFLTKGEKNLKDFLTNFSNKINILEKSTEPIKFQINELIKELKEIISNQLSKQRIRTIERVIGLELKTTYNLLEGYINYTNKFLENYKEICNLRGEEFPKEELDKETETEVSNVKNSTDKTF